jgi:hypothetical protein
MHTMHDWTQEQGKWVWAWAMSSTLHLAGTVHTVHTEHCTPYKLHTHCTVMGHCTQHVHKATWAQKRIAHSETHTICTMHTEHIEHCTPYMLHVHCTRILYFKLLVCRMQTWSLCLAHLIWYVYKFTGNADLDVLSLQERWSGPLRKPKKHMAKA